jgi:hypothetical protein
MPNNQTKQPKQSVVPAPPGPQVLKTFKLVEPSGEVIHSQVVTKKEENVIKHYARATDRMFGAALSGAVGETQAERETNQRLRIESAKLVGMKVIENSAKKAAAKIGKPVVVNANEFNLYLT